MPDEEDLPQQRTQFDFVNLDDEEVASELANAHGSKENPYIVIERTWVGATQQLLVSLAILVLAIILIVGFLWVRGTTTSWIQSTIDAAPKTPSLVETPPGLNLRNPLADLPILACIGFVFVVLLISSFAWGVLQFWNRYQYHEGDVWKFWKKSTSAIPIWKRRLVIGQRIILNIREGSIQIDRMQFLVTPISSINMSTKQINYGKLTLWQKQPSRSFIWSITEIEDLGRGYIEDRLGRVFQGEFGDLLLHKVGGGTYLDLVLEPDTVTRILTIWLGMWRSEALRYTGAPKPK